MTQFEKKNIAKTITKFTVSKNATEIMEELIGYTYTFPREDRGSFLRDGRDFSTMLNSCGRIRKAGVGIAICMGDRNKMLKEGENILSEYRKMIRNAENERGSGYAKRKKPGFKLLQKMKQKLDEFLEYVA